MLNEIQGTRLSQFFQDLIGVLYARDLDAHPVVAYLVRLGLRTVLFHTALQLIHRILHVFIGRGLAHRFVGDAHAALQVKSQIDVLRRAHAFGVQTVGCRYAEEGDDGSDQDQA